MPKVINKQTNFRFGLRIMIEKSAYPHSIAMNVTVNVGLTRSKLLIRLIDRSAKSYDSISLSKLFPGATPKAIEERIAKLKREAKALDGPGKSVKTPPAAPMGKKRRKSTKGMGMGDEDDEEEEYGENKKKVKLEC
ncbi:hypothetical protein BGX38DRAFT_1316416 [Terfezia claveryi]|nr:hypothetical protein BGX38DRAFT_1316416 [Terfezia claveryi]